MKKSIVFKILVIALIFTFVTGCKSSSQTPNFSEESPTDIVSETEPESSAPQFKLNNLTGEYTLGDNAVGKRPVAVMINNFDSAQSVQAGLGNADIVVESLAEGGISRLMAVYADITKIGQIGTIRSARYTYAQHAQSMDAIYVHCGMDDVYTRPYINSVGIAYFDLGARGSSFREKNSLAYEHTLYTNGSLLTEGINKAKFRTDIKDQFNTTYFNFNPSESPVKFTDACTSVKLPLSYSYVTEFKYDAENNKYVRYVEGAAQEDYKTKTKTAFSNILVIYTSYQTFEDNYHLRATSSSGEGLYINGGTYTKINWSKDSAEDRYEITDQNGNEFSLNAGNTWLSLVPKSNSVEIAPVADPV